MDACLIPFFKRSTEFHIEPDGTVVKRKSGEVVVIAEYMGLMTPAVILFRDPKPDFRWPDPPVWNYVDEHVFAKLMARSKTMRFSCTTR